MRVVRENEVNMEAIFYGCVVTKNEENGTAPTSSYFDLISNI
jgi:hypothetical protein